MGALKHRDSRLGFGLTCRAEKTQAIQDTQAPLMLIRFGFMVLSPFYFPPLWFCVAVVVPFGSLCFSLGSPSGGLRIEWFPLLFVLICDVVQETEKLKNIANTTKPIYVNC